MKPDLIIGPLDDPYILRWVLLRFRGWQLALHKIVRSDDDRALHDHVGDNWSLILRGSYLDVRAHEWEHYPDHDDGAPYKLVRWFEYRRAETPHRLVLRDDKPVWTLWLRGPMRRDWGFHCPKGWRHWRDYCDMKPGEGFAKAYSQVGRGCE